MADGSGGESISKKSSGNTYLDYLDKEMTIMGILSTFSVAVVALVLDRMGAADLDKKTLFTAIWKDHCGYVLLGCFCVAIAGALFYRQRSALAWYYGQISLSIESPGSNGLDTEEWYTEADSWDTWTPYKLAFLSLSAGSALFGYSLWLATSYTSILPAWVFRAVLGLWVAYDVALTLIYRHYNYDDDPIRMFLQRKPRTRKK